MMSYLLSQCHSRFFQTVALLMSGLATACTSDSAGPAASGSGGSGGSGGAGGTSAGGTSATGGSSSGGSNTGGSTEGGSSTGGATGDDAGSDGASTDGAVNPDATTDAPSPSGDCSLVFSSSTANLVAASTPLGAGCRVEQFGGSDGGNPQWNFGA